MSLCRTRKKRKKRKKIDVRLAATWTQLTYGIGVENIEIIKSRRLDPAETIKTRFRPHEFFLLSSVEVSVEVGYAIIDIWGNNVQVTAAMFRIITAIVVYVSDHVA